MARGFGTTVGIDAADRIDSAYTAKPTTQSMHIWANFNAGGGNNAPRLVDAAGANSTVILFMNSATSTLVFNHGWDGGAGQWSFDGGLTLTVGLWQSYGVSYDGASTANVPILYYNGADVGTLNVNSAPSGNLGTTAGTYTIGNNATGIRNWDGLLAEAAIWSVILTPAEFAALNNGYSPLLIRPASLVEYQPMIRDNVSLKLAAPTLNGTAVQPHQRMFYNKKRIRRGIEAVFVAPADVSLVGLRGLATIEL
jgi:hypothetical protein